MKKLTSDLIAKLNFGYKNKKRQIKVQNSFVIKKLLNLFILEGVIISYNVYGKYIIISLRCTPAKNQNMFIYNYIKAKNAKFVSVLQLAKLSKKYPLSTFVLSTRNGFVTQTQALKHNTGGTLICQIR